MPITYVPDGPATRALKRRVRGRRPKIDLGNLGPMLDENLASAHKHGHYRYHPDDLRHLKGVSDNPHVVDEGFVVLRELLDERGIAEPTRWSREAPSSADVSAIVKYTLLLAAAMTAGISIAVVLGQDDAIAAMVVAISLISIIGAALFVLILDRCVVHVGNRSNESSPRPGPSSPT